MAEASYFRRQAKSPFFPRSIPWGEVLCWGARFLARPLERPGRVSGVGSGGREMVGGPGDPEGAALSLNPPRGTGAGEEASGAEQ